MALIAINNSDVGRRWRKKVNEGLSQKEAQAKFFEEENTYGKFFSARVYGKISSPGRL